MQTPDASTFIQAKIEGINWVVDPQFFKSSTFSQLSRLPRDYRPEGIPGIVHDHKNRWIAYFPPDRSSNDETVFLKYFYPIKWFERLKYLFKPTKAKTEWLNIDHLIGINVPTPKKLAWGEHRINGFWQRSFLVLEAIRPHETLLALSRSNQAQIKSRFIYSIADAVARLHNAGLYYGDLHGNNIIVKNNNLIPDMFYFVDVKELKLKRNLSDSESIDDLVRLNGFLSGPKLRRLKFLVHYLKLRNIPIPEHRQWLQLIDAKTRKLWEMYKVKKGKDFSRY